jgi:hypothetical protein
MSSFVAASEQHNPALSERSRRGLRLNVVQLVRALPIRWRILSIAGLNSAVVLMLAWLIWDGAKVLNSAGRRGRPPAESDSSLYQPAEPGNLRRDSIAS